MLRLILIAGLIAGVFCGGQLLLMALVADRDAMFSIGMFIGFGTMFLAFGATIFVAVKRHRDVNLGGVIKFLPAFGMGAAIALIGSLCYVLAWEITLPMLSGDFIGEMVDGQVAAMQARGAPQAEIDKFLAEQQWMRDNYGNPLVRVPVTLIEILPVGLLVSLVVAGLLRNSRFLPARAA